jgi:predicted fused transcriptional regulator/phosphomethylpyrimidine kinase
MLTIDVCTLDLLKLIPKLTTNIAASIALAAAAHDIYAFPSYPLGLHGKFIIPSNAVPLLLGSTGRDFHAQRP